MRWVRFGSSRSDEDWGLVLVSESIGEAPVKEAKQDVPGADGRLDMSEALSGGPAFDERKAEFEFFRQGEHSELVALYSDIVQEIHGRVMDIIPEDFHPDHLRGRVTVGAPKHRSNSLRFKVMATCDPFIYTGTAISSIGYTEAMFESPTLGAIAPDSDLKRDLLRRGAVRLEVRPKRVAYDPPRESNARVVFANENLIDVSQLNVWAWQAYSKAEYQAGKWADNSSCVWSDGETVTVNMGRSERATVSVISQLTRGFVPYEHPEHSINYYLSVSPFLGRYVPDDFYLHFWVSGKVSSRNDGWGGAARVEVFALSDFDSLVPEGRGNAASPVRIYSGSEDAPKVFANTHFVAAVPKSCSAIYINARGVECRLDFRFMLTSSSATPAYVKARHRNLDFNLVGEKLQFNPNSEQTPAIDSLDITAASATLTKETRRSGYEAPSILPNRITRGIAMPGWPDFDEPPRFVGAVSLGYDGRWGAPLTTAIEYRKFEEKVIRNSSMRTTPRVSVPDGAWCAIEMDGQPTSHSAPGASQPLPLTLLRGDNAVRVACSDDVIISWDEGRL